MVGRAYDHDWRAVRLTVLVRDGHECQVRLPGCTHKATAVDHRIPLAEGGARLDLDNLRAICTSCNSRRSAGRQQALADALTGRADASPSREW